MAACEMLGLDKGAVADACGMVDFVRRCQVGCAARAAAAAVAVAVGGPTDRM